MRIENVMLSVDWDYFTPEKPEWDIGHKESLIFLDMLWSTRLNLLDVYKTSGEEVEFWDTFKGYKSIMTSLGLVTDSHLHVWDQLRNVTKIILFDAHHDCWKMDNPEIIGCDTWCNAWLRQHKKNQVIWVRPEWSKDYYDLDSADPMIRDQVKVMTLPQFYGDKSVNTIDHVHICRSGCWTPPWLDMDFQRFVDTSGLQRMTSVRKNPWDGYKVRWSNSQLDEYVKAYQEQMRMMKTFDVSSEVALECKTEVKEKV